MAAAAASWPLKQLYGQCSCCQVKDLSILRLPNNDEMKLHSMVEIALLGQFLASVLALKRPRERLQRPPGGCSGPLAAAAAPWAATVIALKPKNWTNKAISTILCSFISSPGSRSGRFSGPSAAAAASWRLPAASWRLQCLH